MELEEPEWEADTAVDGRSLVEPCNVSAPEGPKSNHRIVRGVIYPHF